MKTFEELREATEDMDKEERKEFYRKENIRNELFLLDKEATSALYSVVSYAFAVIFFIFSSWFIGTYMMTPLGMLGQGMALGAFSKILLESLLGLEKARADLKKFRIYNDLYGAKK